jgi:hypothetical protein
MYEAVGELVALVGAGAGRGGRPATQGNSKGSHRYAAQPDAGSATLRAGEPVAASSAGRTRAKGRFNSEKKLASSSSAAPAAATCVESDFHDF